MIHTYIHHDMMKSHCHAIKELIQGLVSIYVKKNVVVWSMKVLDLPVMKVLPHNIFIIFFSSFRLLFFIVS